MHSEIEFSLRTHFISTVLFGYGKGVRGDHSWGTHLRAWSAHGKVAVRSIGLLNAVHGLAILNKDARFPGTDRQRLSQCD